MWDIFTNIGEIKEVFTLVDFYTYIKTVEYLICIGFFCCFPAFYRMINKNDSEESNSSH